MKKKTQQQNLPFSEDAFDIIAQVIIVLDLKGTLLLINTRGCKVLGVKRTDVLNKNYFANFLLPEERDFLKREYNAAVKRGQLDEAFENTVVRSNGELRNMMWHASLVKNKEGKLIGVLCSGEDVTEMRIGERKLRKSEENYRRLVDNISQVVFDIEFKDDLWTSYPSFISDRVFDLTGYTSDEFRNGKVIYQAQIHPQQDQEVKALFWKMFQDKKPVSRSYRFRHKNGEYKWFEDTLLPRFNKDGVVTGCFGVLSEITEKKSFVAVIRDYEKFFNLSTDMFCIAGVDGYFKKVNPSFERILGHPMTVLLSKPFFEFVHPDDLRNTKKELERLSKGVPAVNFENRYRCKDGSYKWFSWNSSATGNTGLLYAVARDISDKKEIGEKIRKNEVFLDSVVENIPNMIFVKDAQTLRFIRFNKAGEQLLGFPRKKMIGKSDYDFFPKKEADFFTKKDKEVLKGKTSIDITEEKVKTRYNGERVLHTKKIPLLDSNGQPEYLLGISEDVTEAIKSREALRKSEEKYKDIVRLIQEGIWMVNEKNKTTFVNEEMAKILNYTPEEMLKKNVLDFMDAEWAKVVEKNLQGKRKGLEKVSELKLRTKDGKERWVLLKSRPLHSDQGKYIGALAAVVDITERKKHEEIIKENERKLEEAQKIARVGSWEFDAERDAILWSDETFRLFGLKPERRIITREEYRSRIHPDDRDMVISNVNAALKGKQFEIEMRVIWPDGSLHYLTGRCHPVYNNNNTKVVKLLGTGMDITEQKLAEVRIMKALVEGQDIERRRIADDLHDSLGQRLSAIKLHAERIVGQGGSQMKGELSKIQQELSDAVDEVRNISHNLVPAVLTDFGLAKTLENLCSKYVNSEKAKVRFRAYNVKSKIPRSVKFGMFRIAQELLNNANRHAHAKEINMQLFERDKKLILMVEDDGRGFNTQKTNFENTFGLNSITSRTRALSGIFTIDSEPGKGTIASIEIPLIA